MSGTFLNPGLGEFKVEVQHRESAPGFPPDYGTGGVCVGDEDGGRTAHGLMTDCRKITPLWKELSQEAIGIFIRAGLPRRIRMGKVALEP